MMGEVDTVPNILDQDMGMRYAVSFLLSAAVSCVAVLQYRASLRARLNCSSRDLLKITSEWVQVFRSTLKETSQLLNKRVSLGIPGDDGDVEIDAVKQAIAGEIRSGMKFKEDLLKASEELLDLESNTIHEQVSKRTKLLEEKYQLDLEIQTLRRKLIQYKSVKEEHSPTAQEDSTSFLSERINSDTGLLNGTIWALLSGVTPGAWSSVTANHQLKSPHSDDNDEHATLAHRFFNLAEKIKTLLPERVHRNSEFSLNAASPSKDLEEIKASNTYRKITPASTKLWETWKQKVLSDLKLTQMSLPTCSLETRMDLESGTNLSCSFCQKEVSTSRFGLEWDYKTTDKRLQRLSRAFSELVLAAESKFKPHISPSEPNHFQRPPTSEFFSTSSQNMTAILQHLRPRRASIKVQVMPAKILAALDQGNQFNVYHGDRVSIEKMDYLEPCSESSPDQTSYSGSETTEISFSWERADETHTQTTTNTETTESLLTTNESQVGMEDNLVSDSAVGTSISGNPEVTESLKSHTLRRGGIPADEASTSSNEILSSNPSARSSTSVSGQVSKSWQTLHHRTKALSLMLDNSLSINYLASTKSNVLLENLNFQLATGTIPLNAQPLELKNDLEAILRGLGTEKKMLCEVRTKVDQLLLKIETMCIKFIGPISRCPLKLAFDDVLAFGAASSLARGFLSVDSQ